MRRARWFGLAGLLAGASLGPLGCAHEPATRGGPPVAIQSSQDFGEAYRSVKEGRAEAARAGDYLVQRDRNGDVEIINTRHSADAGKVFQDSWITTKVKSAYAVDPDVKGTRVHVKTNNGVVTLSGVVSSENEAQQAVGRALEVHGVRAVKSNLEFPKSEAPPSELYMPTEK